MRTNISADEVDAPSTLVQWTCTRGKRKRKRLSFALAMERKNKMKLFPSLVHKKEEGRREAKREKSKKKEKKLCLWSLCVPVTVSFSLGRCVQCTADVTWYMVSLEREPERRHRLTGRDRRLAHVDGRCEERKRTQKGHANNEQEKKE